MKCSMFLFIFLFTCPVKNDNLSKRNYFIKWGCDEFCTKIDTFITITLFLLQIRHFQRLPLFAESKNEKYFHFCTEKLLF